MWIAVALLFTLLILAIYESIPAWRLRHIPSPKGHWLLGHLPALAKNGPDVLVHMARTHGPVFRFNLGRQPVVVVADAELCRVVGIKKFKRFSKRSVPPPIASSPVHYLGVFFADGARWSALRGALNPLYQPARVAALLPTMERVIAVLATMLERQLGSDVDFSEAFLRVATDVIGEVAFGVHFRLTEDESPADVAAFIREHMESTSSLKMDLGGGSLSVAVGIFLPLLQEPCRRLFCRIPGTRDRRSMLNSRRLAQRLQTVIRKRDTSERKDLLSVAESTLGLTREETTALAYEHLLAGSTTTAFTLSMALYLISAHPGVEAKVLAEIDGFGGPERHLTAEELDSCFPYLEAVVKEVMRMHVVSPIVAREATETTEIGRFEVAKGTWVWMAVNALAMDEQQFRDAEAFVPERFLGDKKEKRHPYAHMPFGVGPRACLGMRLAVQEIKVALVRLYQRFTFRLSKDMALPLRFDFGIVLSVRGGVRLRVLSRPATLQDN